MKKLFAPLAALAVLLSVFIPGAQAASRSIQADTTTSELTGPTNFFVVNLLEGSNITITHSPPGKVTIASTGGGGTNFTTIASGSGTFGDVEITNAVTVVGDGSTKGYVRLDDADGSHYFIATTTNVVNTNIYFTLPDSPRAGVWYSTVSQGTNMTWHFAENGADGELLKMVEGSPAFATGREVVAVEEFVDDGNPATAGNVSMWEAIVGGVFNNVASSAGHPGRAVMNSDGSTPNSAIYGYEQGYRFGGGVKLTFEIIHAMDVASSGTERYDLTFGWGDNDGAANTNHTDGAWFYYSDDQNSGNWICKTAASGTVTITNTPTAVGIGGSWTTNLIVVSADASLVSFYVNGTLVATSDSNIPSGTGEDSGIFASILKRVHTAATRQYLLDRIAVYRE